MAHVMLLHSGERRSAWHMHHSCAMQRILLTKMGRQQPAADIRGPLGPGDTCGPSGKGWMYLRGAVVRAHISLTWGMRAEVFAR